MPLRNPRRKKQVPALGQHLRLVRRSALLRRGVRLHPRLDEGRGTGDNIRLRCADDPHAFRGQLRDARHPPSGDIRAEPAEEVGTLFQGKRHICWVACADPGVRAGGMVYGASIRVIQVRKGAYRCKVQVGGG